MASQAQYNAATAAVATIIQADIDQDVPSFFQSEISPEMIQQIATDTAKAAVDAALTVGGTS